MEGERVGASTTARGDRRALAPAVALVAAIGASASGCVIVSSWSSAPPPSDAGIDAPASPPRDAGPIDAPERPVLTREQATRGLLASVGQNVALPTYRALAEALGELEAALVAHASSLSESDRDAARAAWARAMVHVERAELLQFGPAGMAIPEILGGRGLRDAIYVFPTNRCFVDVVVERRVYEDPPALAMQASFARGLGAIEYQLFAESTEHGCDPGASTRVDDAAWAALGPEGVRRRRADAMVADARLARQAAEALLAAWSPGKGDFAGELARAGAGSSVYPSSQAALNAMYWAMFYLDRSVKDMKLGVPTGLSELCGAPSCPGLLESRWAGRSVEHVAENLVGLQQLYLGGPAGGDAIGWDDLLWSIGQEALAIEVETAIAEALAMARAIPSVDAASFADHEAELEALHAAVKRVTDLLKTEVAGVLALTPPPGAGEDND